MNDEVPQGGGGLSYGNELVTEGPARRIHDELYGDAGYDAIWRPSGESHLTTADLGLVVSNDGLHYREPIPDFRLVPAYAELQVTLGIGPFLKHAQAMCNVKDLTMCWYEAWYDGDIRLATWP